MCTDSNIYEKLTHLARGNLDFTRSGKGMHSMITSEEILKTALVIRWLIAAEHWTNFVSTRFNEHKGPHTVINRYLPIILYRSTPHPPVQNLHGDKIDGAISSNKLHKQLGS